MPDPFDPLAEPAATVARYPDLRHAPASGRNRVPIAAALADLLPATTCTVLEVASGTGEHALWVTRTLPHVIWIPTEGTPDGLAAISAWRTLCPELARRVMPPLLVDAAHPPWPGAAVDAVFASNLTHIAPWAVTQGLIAGAAARLVRGGLLLIYGPFNEAGTFTRPGNAAFDADLRLRNPNWGLRAHEELDAAALAQGFAKQEPRIMPADNRLLAYRRL